VQDLTVEVGGRNVVEGATFTIMARDKVGIVGRNGAGKTSMFKVLGGDAEPARGKVTRSGAFGYLSQDPRTSPEMEKKPAISHVLSGRNIDGDLERLEKLRIAMEESSDEKMLPVSPKPKKISISKVDIQPRARLDQLQLASVYRQLV
jgi:ATPase subunit of ABC transporter with duplicated ATPase domains